MSFKPAFPSVLFACVQMDIKLGDIKANISHAEKKIASAINNGADVIILPELFTTGYDLANSKNLAESILGPTVQWMKKISMDNKITLIGSIIEEGEDLPYNTLVVTSPKGIISSYRKIHLFAPMGEADAFNPGNFMLVVNILGWKVGLSICYDLRFAELYAEYADQGIDLLVLCAEWPSVRISHWDSLLVARAIESQCYVVACNRVGKDPMNEFGGHSQIIAPSGEIVSKGIDKEDIIYGETNLELINSSREKFSIVEDRKRIDYQTSL